MKPRATGIGTVGQQADEVVEPLGLGDRLGTENKVAVPRTVADPRQHDFCAGQPPAFEAVGLGGGGVGNVRCGRQRYAVKHLLEADDRLTALRIDQRRGDGRDVEACEGLLDQVSGLGLQGERPLFGSEIDEDAVDGVAETPQCGPRTRRVERCQRGGAGGLVGQCWGHQACQQHDGQGHQMAGTGCDVWARPQRFESYEDGGQMHAPAGGRAGEIAGLLVADKSVSGGLGSPALRPPRAGARPARPPTA